MIFLTILVFVVSGWEIRALSKKKQYGEIAVIIVISALSLTLGYFYLSEPYGENIAKFILDLMGKEF